MLVQTTTPRPILYPERHPAYIYIHTLQKPGTSDGSVLFSSATDPEHGLRNAKKLDPLYEYPIEGETGFGALEYVLPFWELFREEDKKKNLYLVPFCTSGFSVVARSAFRADTLHYDEHVVSFQVMMPVTGGGALRMGDMMLDVANPTFDPWSPDPRGRSFKNLELQETYNRSHCLGNRSEIERRRAERIASAEAAMRGLPEPQTGKLLPPGKSED